VDGGVLRAFENDNEGNDDDGGCAFILDRGGACGGARRPGSSYCPHHHALCHISGGSSREQRQLKEAEALASAVGGRRGRASRTPPDSFLRRLEKIARGFVRPNRSRIVRGEDQ
jgi:hypothetical protein